ncbi:class I SAM-dependent methyltransferase [Streptomyces sp. NPDC015171]|uniref:class I SAM-dependent methyltransferase n=1 Tax=Streptomyces sp. NPDC015171 TaxID=3364945 RepID=UPI0036FE53E9
MSSESEHTVVAAPEPDWDAQAAGFDAEPDHGLRDPAVRAAWADRLRSWLPEYPADVLDLGCGTGSLALLAAEQGHRVTAVDRSGAMVERARAKLAGHPAAVLRGDAEAPPVGDQRFDAVLVRHVLWTLPDPAGALRRWRDLLRPGDAARAPGGGGGRFVLIEGVWGSLAPVGIPAERLTALLGPLTWDVRVERLSGHRALWGKAVDDERYAVLATV